MRLCSSFGQISLRGLKYARLRSLSTSSYDIFKKIKDCNEAESASSEDSDDGRRKPSDRVIRLVDEILNLTLIESADLCDLCQQRLAGPKFNGGYMPGRTPFPHPQVLFSGTPMMPMGGMMMPAASSDGQPIPTHASATASTPSAEASAAPKASQTKSPAKKSTGSVTLVGFEASKKIAVIKIVRTITGLGLRECKELVENLPHVLKKDIAIEDADKIVKEIESAGGTAKMD